MDGETIAKIGRPEEIFCGDTIACLYGVNSQAYDVVSGSMFLQKAKGEPKVFVIGGGGSGIAAYYTLQRDQIPFAAGILSEGDVEYKAAKAKRPFNSRMNKDKLEKKGFERLPQWQDALARYLEELKNAEE